MSKIKRIIELTLHDRKTLRWALGLKFGKSKLSHLFCDRTYLKIEHKAFVGKKLNLKNPKSFNEKLHWLKLYYRKPEHSKLVDKYEVKKIVGEKIGYKYIIPTLGAWNSVEDIDFSSLPERFVIKCTHDSGSVVVCKDKSKLDKDAVKSKLNHGLRTNSYYWGREWPYKELTPRIIAEEYLEDPSEHDLRDYKFFCFNGKVKCFKIDFDRFIDHHANYYDVNGDLLPFGEVVCTPNYSKILKMPNNLTKMIELAEQLSKGEPFVRIDFYEVLDKIYFGEITFFPAAGFGPFIPEEWDNILGSWIELPNKKG